MPPFTPIQMSIHFSGRSDLLTLNPDKGTSVICVLALCTVIICWAREKHWEHKDELPLRITAASTLLFIYGIWWQAAEHGWLWLYQTFTGIAVLGIITAIVMAFLNEDAKFRSLLLVTAALPAILFFILHEPKERPAPPSPNTPEMQQIIDKVNKQLTEEYEAKR